MKWICKYCKREIDYKNKYTVSGHLSKCKDWKNWKKVNLTKDVLIQLYIKDEKSLPEIAKYFDLQSVSTIVNLLKKFKIKIRSVKDASPNRLKKAIKTNIERYGAPHNLSPNHPIRIAYDAKILAEYGAINSFQLESVKEKTKKTILSKYGKEFISQVPFIKEKIKKSFEDRYGVSSPLDLRTNNCIYTKPHKKIVELLKSLGFNPLIEFKLSDIENNKYYYYDIYFDNSYKLLEINGDYFHANPIFYKKSDIITIYNRVQTAEDLWLKDKIKTEFAIKKGYTVLSIWENDINHNIKTVEKTIIDYLK